MSFDIDTFLDAARSRIVLVEFTKVNGETRSMPCTLNPALIGDEFQSEKVSKVDPDASAVAVWALDVNGWRSFRKDSVNAWRVA